MKFHALSTRGVGLIEVVVGTALLVLVFVGFFGVLQLSTRLATDSKAKTTALSLATERMEFLRSLAYDDIGTLEGGDNNNGHGNEDDGYDDSNPGQGGGVGDDFKLFATHYETINLNGVEYVRRSLIAFIDEEADGTSGQDENHKKDDYKVIKVSILWEGHTGKKDLSIVSNATSLLIED